MSASQSISSEQLTTLAQPTVNSEENKPNIQQTQQLQDVNKKLAELYKQPFSSENSKTIESVFLKGLSVINNSTISSEYYYYNEIVDLVECYIKFLKNNSEEKQWKTQLTSNVQSLKENQHNKKMVGLIKAIVYVTSEEPSQLEEAVLMLKKITRSKNNAALWEISNNLLIKTAEYQKNWALIVECAYNSIIYMQNVSLNGYDHPIDLIYDFVKIFSKYVAALEQKDSSNPSLEKYHETWKKLNNEIINSPTAIYHFSQIFIPSSKWDKVLLFLNFAIKKCKNPAETDQEKLYLSNLYLEIAAAKIEQEIAEYKIKKYSVFPKTVYIDIRTILTNAITDLTNINVKESNDYYVVLAKYEYLTSKYFEIINTRDNNYNNPQINQFATNHYAEAKKAAAKVTDCNKSIMPAFPYPYRLNPICRNPYTYIYFNQPELIKMLRNEDKLSISSITAKTGDSAPKSSNSVPCATPNATHNSMTESADSKSKHDQQEKHNQENKQKSINKQFNEIKNIINNEIKGYLNKIDENPTQYAASGWSKGSIHRNNLEIVLEEYTTEFPPNIGNNSFDTLRDKLNNDRLKFSNIAYTLSQIISNQLDNNISTSNGNTKNTSLVVDKKSTSLHNNTDVKIDSKTPHNSTQFNAERMQTMRVKSKEKCFVILDKYKEDKISYSTEHVSTLAILFSLRNCTTAIAMSKNQNAELSKLITKFSAKEIPHKKTIVDTANSIKTIDKKGAASEEKLSSLPLFSQLKSKNQNLSIAWRITTLDSHIDLFKKILIDIKKYYFHRYKKRYTIKFLLLKNPTEIPLNIRIQLDALHMLLILCGNLYDPQNAHRFAAQLNKPVVELLKFAHQRNRLFQAKPCITRSDNTIVAASAILRPAKGKRT